MSFHEESIVATRLARPRTRCSALMDHGTANGATWLSPRSRRKANGVPGLVHGMVACTGGAGGGRADNGSSSSESDESRARVGAAGAGGARGRSVRSTRASLRPRRCRSASASDAAFSVCIGRVSSSVSGMKSQKSLTSCEYVMCSHHALGLAAATRMHRVLTRRSFPSTEILLGTEWTVPACAGVGGW